MKRKIINFFERWFDNILLKDRIKLLEKRVKELEAERQPLIDMNNKRLSELRVKNLELGKLKKRLNEIQVNRR